MAEILFGTSARLSFPKIVEPAASTEGGVKKYSGDFIFAPDSDFVKQFGQAYSTIAQEKWKEHASAVMQMIQSDRKLRCFGNGAEKINKKTFKPYDGYEGQFYVSANNESAPQMINADGSPVDASNTMAYQAMARKLYGGCYVNVALKLWPQDNKHGRGIRCELVAIQFAADGEAFGEAAPDASGFFKPVAAANLGANPFGAVAAPAAPAGLPSFFS